MPCAVICSKTASAVSGCPPLTHASIIDEKVYRLGGTPSACIRRSRSRASRTCPDVKRREMGERGREGCGQGNRLGGCGERLRPSSKGMRLPSHGANGGRGRAVPTPHLAAVGVRREHHREGPHCRRQTILEHHVMHRGRLVGCARAYTRAQHQRV
eukprot:scaffold4944_cov135-Isochrysis_galbana.AAC.4